MIATTEAYGLNFAYPAGDLAVGACLRDYGEFSRMGVTLSIEASRGRGFLDVGANIGAFALPVSRYANSVVAIEAHPGLADLLKRNVEANERSNIKVVQAAAGGARGTIDFPTPSLDDRMNFGSIGIGQTAKTTARAEVIRLDDVAPDDVAMVKIDVEGFELEVLKGADRLLRRMRPWWLVEFSDPALVTILQDAGYRTYWFFDAFVTPKAPKRSWVGSFRGDLSILATPIEGPRPAGMIEAVPGQPAPDCTAGFEYLRAFGMEPTASSPE